MSYVENEILTSLKKMDLGMAKTRLEFLLRRTDLKKKTRRLIETYLETITEMEKTFYNKIEKSL